ncbi:MAG: hypothetical protein KOO60_07220 [Gemmatimonadales bacterium]|nr:hypothetical protein [Gemmatimonadales bacterium]
MKTSELPAQITFRCTQSDKEFFDALRSSYIRKCGLTGIALTKGGFLRELMHLGAECVRREITEVEHE